MKKKITILVIILFILIVVITSSNKTNQKIIIEHLMTITPTPTCPGKTCEDLALEGKTCGKWNNGCDGMIDCGPCPPQCGKEISFGDSQCPICTYENYLNKVCTPIQATFPYFDHININCDASCNSQIKPQKCDRAMSFDNGSINIIGTAYQNILNFYGGETNLNSLNYPFPDASILMVCNYILSPETPNGEDIYTYPSIQLSDSSSLKVSMHELMHHFNRWYNDIQYNYLIKFEEGITTQTVDFCTKNLSNPCCEGGTGCDIPNYYCYNYNSSRPLGIQEGCTIHYMQMGLIRKLARDYGCDINNCWKQFLLERLNHPGDKLTSNDVYRYIVNYTGKDPSPLFDEYEVEYSTITTSSTTTSTTTSSSTTTIPGTSTTSSSSTTTTTPKQSGGGGGGGSNYYSPKKQVEENKTYLTSTTTTTTKPKSNSVTILIVLAAAIIIIKRKEIFKK